MVTTGSFDSEQALVGFQMFFDRGYNRLRLDKDLTYLFEIIYPENRIVCDYGDDRRLVFIGTVTRAGRFMPSALIDGHPFGDVPRTINPKDLPAHEMFDYLNRITSENAEGWVVHYPDTGHTLKVKSDRYVELHRLVSNMTPKALWRYMYEEGKTMDQLVGELPEEWTNWVVETASSILHERSNYNQRVKNATLAILLKSEERGWDRRQIYQSATRHPKIAHMIMMLIDGNTKRLSDALWRMVEPKGNI
jgi:RNA ligase